MSGSNVGIAMVGCGQIAEAHLKAVQANENSRVVWCTDVDSDRAAEAADRYSSAHHGTDYDQVLNDHDVDAVVLCLPHDLHVSFTCRALQAGKHVLVEKPMALDESEAREMTAAADASGKNLMVGQSTRFHASHQEAYRLIRSGRIGMPINAVRQTCFFVERLSTDWRRDLGACGGLYLPLFGSHDVDAMLWLLDDTPDRVSAAVRAGSGLSDGDVNGWIGMTFADAKVASISFSLQTKESRQTTLIVGSEAAMTLSRNGISIDGEDIAFDNEPGAFVMQMREFVDSIRESRPPSVPGSDGVRTMRVLDLARRSSESQTTQIFQES